MPITTSAVAQSYTADGAYIQEVPPQPVTPIGPNTSVLIVVGGATDGVPNTPSPFSDAPSLFATYGRGTTIPYSLVDEALHAMPECQQFLGLRVTDGTDTAATMNASDNTGFAALAAPITFTGTPGSNQVVTVTFVSGSITVATIGYPIAGANTPTSIALAVAGLINNSAAVNGANAFLARVVPASATIPIAALKSGTAGNSITVAVAVTGSGITATPNSATPLATGAAPGNVLVYTAATTGSASNGGTNRTDLQSGTILASPVLQITLQKPGQNPEVFQNIVAYASPGGAYDAPTFKANALAAINTISATRAKSSFWTVAAGNSTASPLRATVQSASGGTDGTAGLNTSLMLGQDGLFGRTGMFAVRGVAPGGTLVLAQLTDLIAFQTVAQFCQTESLVALMAFPSGTPTTTAVNAKAENAASSRFVMLLEDWEYTFDSVASMQRFVSPLGAAGGIVASIPPYQYPGNQPVQGKVGITGTESTVGQPLSLSQIGQRASNGINFLYRPIPRGSVFGLYHGLASDGTLFSDTRMMNFIAIALQQLLGQYVGAMQTTLPKDQTRSQVKASITAFLQSLVKPIRQISGYSVDDSANTETSIMQGFLREAVNVQTLSAARFVVAMLQVGNTVQVTWTPALAA